MAIQRRSLANSLKADIGTALVELYTVPPNTTIKPVSLYVSNKLTSDITVDIVLRDPGTGIDFVLGANVGIGIGETLMFFDQECYLRAGQSLHIKTDQNNASDTFLNMEVFKQ